MKSRGENITLYIFMNLQIHFETRNNVLDDTEEWNNVRFHLFFLYFFTRDRKIPNPINSYARV